MTEFGQSIVMVTHDPRGASYADRVVFLADGSIVDEMADPTPESVLERIEGWAPDMWRVTIKGLLAHKLRLALTALGHRARGDVHLRDVRPDRHTAQHVHTLFGNIYQHVDFQVRGEAAFGSGGTATRKPIPESLAGHGAARPRRRGRRRLCERLRPVRGHDGKAMTSGGAPTIGLSFDPNPQISALRLSRARTRRPRIRS